MSNTKTLLIEGEINSQMSEKVRNFLKPLLAERNQRIVFYINSEGGNLESLRRIKSYMYFMTKYKGHKFIGRLVYGESAALLLFLNCDEREVKEGESVGKIHLPILNRAGDLKKLQDEREDQISFIMRRTKNKVSWQQVLDMENKKLYANDLVSLGFATKKVIDFS